MLRLVRLATLSCLLSCLGCGNSSHPTAPTPTSTQPVWVLSDTDNTSGGQDSLIVLAADGSSIRRSGGFKIDETVGGYRRVNAHTPDGSCWVNNSLEGTLIHIASDGTQLETVSRAVAGLDLAADGTLYVLLSDGTIFGSGIQHLDTHGGLLASRATGGLDVVVDRVHGTVWAVGAYVHRYDMALSTDTLGYKPRGTAVSIDYDTDGSVWIADRYLGDVDSVARLVHLGPKGDSLGAIALPASPMCVRVDRAGRVLWAATTGGVYRCDLAGTPPVQVPADFAMSLDVDGTGTVWVATHAGFMRIARTGQVLGGSPLPGRPCQRFITAGD